jgi:hypothetical protein
VLPSNPRHRESPGVCWGFLVSPERQADRQYLVNRLGKRFLPKSRLLASRLEKILSDRRRVLTLPSQLALGVNPA